MSKQAPLATELEAREVAEAAREEQWERRSFSKRLFDGRLALDLIHPHPEPDPEEEKRAAPFLEELYAFARDHIDGDAIDRDGWVPDEVLKGLAELGAFGIKIPREYGGLGLSQVSYNRALSIVASRCSATGAFLSAHQSIGVPGPLLMFGTDEQKKRLLPRLATGALSAFALTEPDAGSDPANLSTAATLSDDGDHWVLNGEKLWCTNGPRADIIIVMARTPAREGVRGKRPVTAFIVETDSPGVTVVHTSSFMGLKGLSNGVLRFENVKVPKENLLWGEGKGLKLALITLNVGRLSLPAFCSAAAKASLEICREWSNERVQWGQPIGRHEAISQMLGSMAADTFAMDSVVSLTSSMADTKQFDIRLEAAFAKMWNSEKAWETANDALQIRAGRGYETHDSLEARGEKPYPVERMVRDLRINLIFEGSSEIMRLFIAREAVDDHLRVAGDLIDPRASTGRRVAALFKAALHYAWWFPTRFLGWGHWPRFSEFGPLATHLRFIDRNARKLARSTFYTMVRFGPSLDKRQAVLGRIVDVGAELFVMTAACVRAHQLTRKNPSDTSPTTLADLFCRQARRRVEDRFDNLFDNDDAATNVVARQTMEGRFAWLEEGIVSVREGYSKG
ncbi:acyl-CoA dehydrogenase family protein [Gemmatimonadota bacterium DH-20]|uniref:Acyl-CoA dehydrogenase family protein n=1 Tax=Gaopeijia maritima TaxID=3119007 RepID=A0ABU9E5I9_9BACT